MAIKLRHLSTHGMMEQTCDELKQSCNELGQACDVLDGVVCLKTRIAELEKENESLKYSVAALETDLTMSQRWRKFSEEKPEEKQWVLVFVENPSKYGTYVELRRWDASLKFDVEGQELYTKWMPLPSAPKEL